jgi:nucleoside-diphosphate-sugar epimerase
MTPTVLVTGATGSLGPTILGEILRRGGSVIALVRPGREIPRIETDAGRVEMIAGDLKRRDAALTLEERRALSSRATHVLHLAAETRFSLELPEALAGNLHTTQVLLRLAQDFDQLQAFGFASTLYVAGTRSGDILEEELEETGFVNTYEQAKFETERWLRARMSELPIAVYRMATLLGSRQTGEVRKPTAIHQAFRLHHRGLVPMIPGDPDQRVELLDAEHASEAMARLLLEAFSPGTTYHLTAGARHAFALAELVGETHRAFEELSTEWARRGIEPPPIVSPRAYGLFERSVEQAGDPALKAIVRSLSTFLPQLAHPKRFDRTNTVAALPDWDPPHPREYLSRVLGFLLNTGWLSNPAGSRSRRRIPSTH